MTQDHNKADKRDHGGGIDAAIVQYGGTRNDWIASHCPLALAGWV